MKTIFFLFQTIVSEEEIDKTHWGELESESECEESEEESSEEELDTTGLITPGAEGYVLRFVFFLLISI